ncbi:MAG: hypothetical protein CMJ76_16030 [Planctomycetaceae bacterium]|nr:hypothetical protein [Planctomycetaceae bacterium]
MSKVSFTISVLAVILTSRFTFAKPTDILTMSFRQAEQIKVENKVVELGSHVTTRLFDLNEDGVLDLLTGDGRGNLLAYGGTNSDTGVKFRAPINLRAGSKSRWGNSYTGVVLAEIAGNKAADLVVAHSSNKISIHTCTGNDRLPIFSEQSIDIKVQDNCQGRFDVADWNGDGLADLITGSFGGPVIWYPNIGTKQKPVFSTGRSFHEISRAYNSQPRIIDFNQDGKLDLVLGVNWGTIEVYLNTGTTSKPQLARPTTLRWADRGGALNLRSFNGDDTTPDFADLNDDGVVDLVSGGKNGKVFIMTGVGITDHLSELKNLLQEYPEQLGVKIANDQDLRGQCFGLLSSMQAALNSRLVPDGYRAQTVKDLRLLVAQYPHYFKRQTWDLKKTPHLPALAAQMWIVLFEAYPDSLENRRKLAELAGFDDGYKTLLENLGVLFIDNNTATTEQTVKMATLLAEMPRAVWDVETITVRGWLGDGFKQQGISSRTGVNIFSLPLGRPENSFPADAPRKGVTDVFMICLAHEIAHNMLDTVGRQLRPELFELKYEQLEFAAGELVEFHPQKSRGVNWEVTKSNLRREGIWDGQDASWQQTWKDYLESEPFSRAHVRGSLHFFIQSPQEAFATLANQYFTDSQLMLELGIGRWQDGHKSSINQFLLIADYLSQKKNSVRFYQMGVGGNLKVEEVILKRNKQGQISALEADGWTVQLEYDGNLVSRIKVRGI